MSKHTTLEVGGPADVFVEPADREEMQAVARVLKDLELPTLILGGGANLVVADKGVRGAVLSTKGLNRLELLPDRIPPETIRPDGVHTHAPPADGAPPGAAVPADRAEEVPPEKASPDGARADRARPESTRLGRLQHGEGAAEHAAAAPESARRRIIRVEAGAPISDVAERTARNNLSGLEFLYSMPGSVGGAVWMNARCYGSSVSDVLVDVDYLDENRQPRTLHARDHTFAYKSTPFQDRDTIILGCRFQLRPERWEVLEARMEQYRADRERKGHFAAPSAGSMFKNNREFGRPTGQLIDELGLRGTQIGGARISDLHANIIVNAGGASAADIDALATLVERRVSEHFGFTLEREVRFVGAWASTTSSNSE